MKTILTSYLSLLGVVSLFLLTTQTLRAQGTEPDQKPATMPEIPKGYQTATFAAGCYWCVEAVFQQLDGVHSATSGFIGGHVKNPKYKAVITGSTGHAEAVQIVFNPQKINYETLLAWFWKAHDPTQLNRQGADVGTQYRSGIFYHSAEQKNQAIKSRSGAQADFPSPIVTEITQATVFYPAKVSHQDYYRINGNKDRYCRLVIEPKLKKLNLEK